ncbi:MAG TPA: hypothetical protein VF486_20625 [Actinomycetes bacterium]
MAVTPAIRVARPRWRPGYLAWSLWALATFGIGLVPWLDRLLRQAGRPDLVNFTTGAWLPSLAAVSASTVGAVLATRRPRHPVGWLLLAFSLDATASGVAASYANYGLLARPGALPGARLAALYFPVAAVTALTCISFVLLLTPTGSLPSPRWRWWAWITAAAPAVLVLTLLVASAPSATDLVSGSPFDYRGFRGVVLVANQVALAITVPAVLVAAGSLVVRFRRARGSERQQLRWVTYAAVLTAVGAAIIVALALAGNTVLVSWVAGGCVTLLPLALGAAILRYRLYDLDRIISRTVAYGLLTLLLGGGYAGLVLGLGQLFGQDSSLVVAGATLAVAAVVRPARRRVQAVVDRRFNRRRYDAARTIQAFSARLRQQVDLDTLTGELLAVVDQTMQPTRVSLWLRRFDTSAGSADQTVARQRT